MYELLEWYQLSVTMYLMALLISFLHRVLESIIMWMALLMWQCIVVWILLAFWIRSISLSSMHWFTSNSRWSITIHNSWPVRATTAWRLFIGWRHWWHGISHLVEVPTLFSSRARTFGEEMTNAKVSITNFICLKAKAYRDALDACDRNVVGVDEVFAECIGATLKIRLSRRLWNQSK